MTEPRSISVQDSEPYYSWCIKQIHPGQWRPQHPFHQVLECCTHTPGSPLRSPPYSCDTDFTGAKGLHFFQYLKNGLTCCKTFDKSLLSALSAMKGVSEVISLNPAHMTVLARTEFLPLNFKLSTHRRVHMASHSFPEYGRREANWNM